MTKFVFLIVLIVLISCISKRSQYEKLISKVDSISIVYNNSGRVINLSGDKLNLWKELLIRKVDPENQRAISKEVTIKLYILSRNAGELQIENDSTPFANFNSKTLKFGFQMSYGLGMSLDQLNSN